MTAEELKALRKRMGMTQQQLSTEVGIAMSTLSRWERGDGTPKGAALKLLQSLSRANRRPAK